ncbi:MAG: polymer-forming cytoskeletal protein, partial [Clostridia bacterium]|nr:polymer-forming cytoskeletal protein [Clostridia bacterium]
MNTSSFRKNKKGAAMIYAIMVLLLLSTVIVALTALASASYTDAVLSVSDDQSYYYAKSIGLAVKEQFKDGYSIAKIIDALNKEEATHDQKWANGEYYDPVVKGTFNITGEDGHLVNGTVQCRYARTADDSANRNVIEVTAACVVNNSPSVVTSVYSCEKDTGEEADHLAETLTDYDVVLTTGANQNFDFTQASDSSNSSSVNVYVYTDEDASTSEKTFPLYYNMYGKLTTTGKVLISSMTSKSNSNPAYHIISGNLTSYGDMTLKYTGVQGAYGLHADGNVLLKARSFVTKDIYAHGNVTIEDPGVELHNGYFWADAAGGRFIAADTAYHSANNIAATGNVTLGKRAYVTGSVYSQGDVSVTGKGATPGQSGYTDHFGNTCVRGSIYAQGKVTISNGAVVVGDVIATKGVIIEKGAVVMGNVTSVNEGVSVLGSAVGGEVHAKTYLWVQNYQTAQGSIPQADYSSYARYLREFDASGTGVVFYGGIGLLQPAGKTYKHTCKYFGTDDGDYVTIVRGDLHVSGAIESDYTPFLSVWCTDSVYLEGSRARFTDVKTRICDGISPNNAYHMSGVSIHPGIYVYTYIHELNQTRDFCETSGDNPYLDMHGARIDVLNIGSSYVNDLYDGYLFKGWVGNVNARCLSLADMHLDGYVYAAQYCYTWGTASAWAASNANYGAYYFANGLTQSTGTIEVACRDGMYYNGRFNNETHLGYWLGKRCLIYGLVNVGYEQYEDSYVILGDESDRGSSYLIGG